MNKMIDEIKPWIITNWIAATIFISQSHLNTFQIEKLKRNRNNRNKQARKIKQAFQLVWGLPKLLAAQVKPINLVNEKYWYKSTWNIDLTDIKSYLKEFTESEIRTQIEINFT